jgi:DNA-binding XRE family transcriptional regulator
MRTMARNNLKIIREMEGLTKVTLAILANLSTKTISRIEEGRHCPPVTQGKIVKALNRVPDKLRDYSLEDIFPTEVKSPTKVKAKSVSKK